MTSHVFSNIKFISLDYQSGNVSILGADNQLWIDRIPIPVENELVTRSTFIPAESVMEIMAGGEKLTMSLRNSLEPGTAPSIYLDQNHWIDFARWRKDPAAVDSGKASFFAKLATAVDDGRVVLPLSSAHLVETSKRGGASRLDLARTMLRYSRGWQVRSVLALRRTELRALFGGIALLREDIITLAPQAVFDMATHRPFENDLGREVNSLIRRQIWATVLVTLLLDPQPNIDAGAQVATRWANSFPLLANELRHNPLARKHSREATKIRFFADLGKDLPAAAAQSGMSPEDFSKWLKSESETAISKQPGLGRIREVLHLRLSNAGDKWERNDLNDLLYLPYAAAYCDMVIGEKKMIHYLQQVTRKCPPGAILHRRSSEALPDLELLLNPAAQRKRNMPRSIAQY